MTRQLRIDHADGTTTTLRIVQPDDAGDDTLPSLTSLRTERNILREPDQTDTCEVAVYRGAWAAIQSDIDSIDDKFVVTDGSTDYFGGRLYDWTVNGPTVSVVLHGPKADALGASPSSGADVYQPQSDKNLVENKLLSRVDTVSAGTVTEQSGSVGFEESHASPGKSLTKLAEQTGSEILYQPDFTLDYVDSLGSDRTGTVLSPSNQTVLGDPRVNRREREDFTHIRVLGSQNGSTQFQVERVIDDTTTREKWGLFTEKDAQSQSRVDDLADQIQSELQSDDGHLEVDVTVPPTVSPSLGDEFSVRLPEEGIDTTLRALRVTHVLDSGGERYSLLLTNRRLARELQGERQARSADEFDSGNPGQYYALADGEGWDAVDSGENYEFSFYRPSNTIAEYRAVMQLESREYRLRADQVGHSHSVTIPDHNHSVSIPDHSHGVSISDTVTSGNNSKFDNIEESTAQVSTLTTVTADSETSLDTYSPNNSGSRVVARVTYTADDVVDVFLRIYRNGTNIDTIKVTNGNNFDTVSTTLFIEQDCLNDSLEVTAQDARVGTGTPEHDATWIVDWVVIGNHTHDVSISDTTTTDAGGATTETTSDGGGTTESTDSVAAVDPGINTISGETVSNVAVDINGTTVASGLSHADLSSGRTIDISGQLDDGDNRVSISSDTLGELRGTVEYEGLKNANQ